MTTATLPRMTNGIPTSVAGPRLPAHLADSVKGLDLSRFKAVVYAGDPDPDLAAPGLYLIQAGPDRLERWLALNDNVRRYTRSHGLFLTRQMAADRWDQRVSDTIKFKTTGMLGDGQHRLYGARETGKVLFFHVETGVPPEAFKYIDSGMSRHLHHRVQFTGDAGADRAIAGVLNFWRCYRTSNTFAKLTPDEALGYYRDHQRALDWVVSVVNKRLTGPARPATLAALCEFHERDAWRACQFAACLYDRESVEIQPAVYLRQKMSETVGTARRIHPADQFLMTIAACCAFLEGRPVHSLKKRDW